MRLSVLMKVHFNAALFLLVTVGTGSALGASYPDRDKPLRMIVPYGAGAATDVIARALGKAVTEVSGLTVVVENKPGADTLIGAQAVMSAPADGYTMLLGTSSTAVINPLIVPNNKIDMVRDFTPLVTIAKNHQALNLGPSTSFKTVREFVAAAKAKPGKYTYGSASTTSLLAAQLFEARAGVEMLSVPYKTTSAAITALASGEVDVVFSDLGTVKSMSDSGRVRQLAIGAPTRLPTHPQLPTLIEEGVKDYKITSWFAAYFSSQVPSANSIAMREILSKAVMQPTYISVLKKVDLDPFNMRGEDINRLTRTEIDMWRKVLQEAKTDHRR